MEINFNDTTDQKKKLGVNPTQSNQNSSIFNKNPFKKPDNPFGKKSDQFKA